MSQELLFLLIGLVLTIGTGLFVASEFALVNLDRAELEARQERGETMLGPTIRALKITSTHLSSAQLGITLTTLLAGFTLEPALSTYLSPGLVAIGLPEAAISVVESEMSRSQYHASAPPPKSEASLLDSSTLERLTTVVLLEPTQATPAPYCS